MTSEWLTAIASIGTFIVIASTAIAALIQLRHMRSSNQITALNEFRETLESEYYRDAFERVQQTLPDLLEDPRIRREIVAGKALVTIKELVPVRALTNVFELCGAFIKRGIIDPDVVCDLWGDVVLRNWELVAPLVVNLRAARQTDAIWENFEHLAAVCSDFQKAHPHGTVTKRFARETMPPVWPEVVAAIKQHEDKR